MNNDILFLIILVIVIAYVFAIYKIESMGDVSTQLTQDQVKDLIKQIYLADVEAIRNLSNVATQLQAGSLTIPGNLTIGGELNIKDTNTKLLRGDGNALRIKTPSGFVDIGSQNDGWCHIYTDRPKFAFNKQLTDVSADPYNDYIKIKDKTEIQNNSNNLKNELTNNISSLKNEINDTTNDYIWGVNGGGNIYRCKAPCNNSAWEQISGGLRNVSVGKNYIWGVNGGGNIYRCKKPCPNAQWEQINGGLSNISGD